MYPCFVVEYIKLKKKRIPFYHYDVAKLFTSKIGSSTDEYHQEIMRNSFIICFS